MNAYWQNLKVQSKEEPHLENWKAFLGKLKNPVNEVNIALVGKYVSLPDAYKSIAEAFVHAGTEHDCKVNVKWISSEEVTRESVSSILANMDGVLVAPGFGERGLEGKIETIRLRAREQDSIFRYLSRNAMCSC